jgi:hypothetical protein
METLEIKKAAALAAHENATNKGKKLLEDLLGKKVFVKNIREQLQNFEDVLEYHGIDKYHFADSCKGLSPDVKGYIKEKLIVSAYNEGKLPDFTDGTYKYYPIFKMGSPSGVGFSFSRCDLWLTHSGVGALLVFCGPNAKVNMLDAVEKFLDVYKESRTL